MNKKILIICSLIVVIVILITIFFINTRKNENIDSFKSEVLCELKKEDKNTLENFKSFYSVKWLGSKTNGNTTYIYAWVQKESYYTDVDGVVNMYEGYSIPYRFSFENGEYVCAETPKTGKEYSTSVKSIFPIKIYSQFDNIYEENDFKADIKNQVEKYYKISYEKVHY